MSLILENPLTLFLTEILSMPRSGQRSADAEKSW